MTSFEQLPNSHSPLSKHVATLVDIIMVDVAIGQLLSGDAYWAFVKEVQHPTLDALLVALRYHVREFGGTIFFDVNK